MQAKRSDLRVNVFPMSDEDFLLLRASLRAQIRKKGIGDSVGAVGEPFAIERFRKNPDWPNLQMAPCNPKNGDAFCRTCERFSIKTVCEGSKTRAIYSDSADREKQMVEHLLITKLVEDLSSKSIPQLAWAGFKADETCNA